MSRTSSCSSGPRGDATRGSGLCREAGWTHDEDPVAAGLRELREETCLVAEPHDIIGVLDNCVTDSGFLITPLVIVPPRQRKPRRAPAEIHSIHPVAVEALTAPGVPRWSRLPDGRPLLQMPLRRGLVVHAPTGAILWQFAEVGLRGRQTRVQNLVQPAFTRH